MIEAEDLSKSFDGILAVDGITLRVDAGEVLALLGPNGAGKTTTVRMLTSILAPTRGWARVAGFDVTREARLVRASVGVLTEHHGLYRRMQAIDYLDFFGQLYGLDLPTRKQRARLLLEEFGLAEYGHQRIGKFSRGMQQKLALARALLHDPPVLLLDEPTSSLDPESTVIVRDAIQHLRSSARAVILCTHNLAEAEKMADQIAIIRAGRIIAQGSPMALQQKWLGPPEFEIHLGSAQPMDSVKLPADLPITDRGNDWLRFRPRHPELDNPLVLKSLLEQGFSVISLVEVPRNLEQIYLEVVNQPDEIEVLNAD
jgi:ABC-2 type transport system ATP-binding protein